MSKAKKLEKPVWLKYNEEEVKEIILKLADKGLTAEKIGLVLRDQYGIPKVSIYGLKIGKVLKEQDKFQKPSLINLQKKVTKLEEHYAKNKQDKKTERAMMITKSKLKKFQDYIKNKEQ
ncbi:MAG: 30S ribosomal protein S15 [Nanoarchaeota archaeon]